MLKALPLACFILFAGCQSYQYMTVTGKNIPENVHHNFAMENDSIVLIYSFAGYSGPIRMQIENKLDKPIYVDWSKSSLIVNDRSIGYLRAEVPVLDGTGTGVSEDGSGNVEFIPPGSHIEKTPMGITNSFHYARGGGIETRRENVMLTSGYSATVIRTLYNEETTPLNFSSYLTLYMDESRTTPVVMKHSFYVSEIVKTSLAPRNFQAINDQDGNKFYVGGTTGFGRFGYGVLAQGVEAVTYSAIMAAGAAITR